MNKILLIIVLLFNFQIGKAQTFTDIATWIGNNSNGGIEVKYDTKNQKILIIERYWTSFPGIAPRAAAYFQAFDPKAVRSISTVQSEDGLNLMLNFSSNGTPVYKWFYGTENNIGNAQMLKFEINIKASESQAIKLKTAFIDLFKKLSVTISNGDLY